MKKIFYLSSIVFFVGCTTNKEHVQEENYSSPPHHMANLIKVFDAHGGYENWNKLRSLSYKKGNELTITNLKNRKILVASPDRTIGFDGKNVWIAPDTLDASGARFYHNLYFYFYAMPFVVGDPGAYYEALEPRTIQGKTYGGIKVSYNEGVGDAPDDNYIIWYDPKTFQMEWLMYTVTYRSGQPNDRYSLIKYEEWKTFEKVLLPQKLTWYHYQNDLVGDIRSEVFFKDINLSEEAPESALFEMPDDAMIAPI